MPIGYVISTGLMATCVLLALAPPCPLRSSPLRVSFVLGFLVNELPFVALYCLTASTALAIVQSGVGTVVFWIGFDLAILASVGLVWIGRRALRTRAAVDRAMRESLGAGWRTTVGAGIAVRRRRRLPLARIMFAPFVFRRHDVERLANIRYGDAGRRNLLDLYRHRAKRGGPTLVHLHGGAFFMGGKSREARPLFSRLASQGWVCVSANYRLRPAATLEDQLIDVKKVLAWVRERGREYGADPKVVFVAGSSAGAQLAALAALTPNVPAFQPGFEQTDTSVTAAVCLYGYYGPLDPARYDAGAAPPFFVAHGDLDTLVIPADARRFVDLLRRTSPSPVVYAELPGAQHSFDLFHSLRFEAVVDAIEAFAAWVQSGTATRTDEFRGPARSQRSETRSRGHEIDASRRFVVK